MLFLSFFRYKTMSYNGIHSLVGNVGEKCHLACSLDRGGQLALVKSTGAGYTSRKDLRALGDELSELRNILVIDALNLVLAEDANLLSLVHRTEGSGTLGIFHVRNLSDSRFLYSRRGQ